MADFGSPVAQNVNVNPMQGIQTLSGLLSLKRQQVGLEQQQQELETQTAQAYQASQSATERQNLSRVNWKQFVKPDGSADIASATIAAQTAAPTTWPDFMDRFEQASTGGAETKKAWYNLNQTYQNGLRSIYTAWGQDPSKNIVDLQKQIDVYKQTAPDDAQDQIGTIQSHVAKILAGPDLLTGANKSLPDQKRGALSYGQAGLGQEQLKPQLSTAIVKGGALAGIAQNPLTAGIQQAPGAVLPGLSPTQTPGYLAQAAGATATGGGVGTVDVQRFSGITNAAATAQTGVALADQVAALADQVRTGELSKEWADKLTVLKQSDPTITARQMLAKYAAQLKTTATQGAATDSERAQIDAGMPSPESMNPAAVKNAAQYLHGYFRMNQARGVNAMQHVGQTGSVAGLTQKDTTYMQNQDPFVHSFRDMAPAQQKQFLLERYGPGGSKDPQGFADFEQRVKGKVPGAQ